MFSTHIGAEIVVTLGQAIFHSMLKLILSLLVDTGEPDLQCFMESSAGNLLSNANNR